MPTERFYRLSEDKKMSIRDAAIREFIRVPFEKASINQIIRTAEISRGSFYTYFEDKRDVLSFILEDMKEKAQKLCLDSLEINGGDFWIMMEALLEYGIAYCAENDILQLSKNTVQFQDGMGIFVEAGPGDDCYEDQLDLRRRLYERVDTRDMNISGLQDFIMLLEMGVANLMITIGRYYQNPSGVDDLRESFHKRMAILRRGTKKDVRQNRGE